MHYQASLAFIEMISDVKYMPLNVALSELLSLLQLCVIVEGLYQVEVRLLGYENPTGRCQACQVLLNGIRSCCDDFGKSDGCTDDDRECDSYFTYCLRPFGSQDSQEGGCSNLDNSERMTSNVSSDDGSIDFTQDIVLGLDNPFHLQGLTNDYTVSECMVRL